MKEEYSRVLAIYEGSDGDATRALYARLQEIGPIGHIAVNVFRAHKNSARAKVYRGGQPGKGSFSKMAYERKHWSMSQLCGIMLSHGETCRITWGWGIDSTQPTHNQVLYIDLPTGQVSFHTDQGGEGPDYTLGWDGIRGVAVGRICSWAGRLLRDAKPPELRFA
jgi:hypothetical protein